MSDTDSIEGFIAKWSQSSGDERANYALFLTDLCDTLGVPRQLARCDLPTSDQVIC